MTTTHERTALLARLRDDIAACERPTLGPERPVIQTGLPALDRLLPLGGVRRGSLIELLDDRAGAETIAAALTAVACRSGGEVVIVDSERQFYPPALAAWGVPLERQVVIRSTKDADALWAADQALRSRAVSAVWLRRERLTPHDFRRLQLAAEEGGAVGVLFRPLRVRGQPTWADVQLVVEPRPAMHGLCLHVALSRCRGGADDAAVIEIAE